MAGKRNNSRRAAETKKINYKLIALVALAAIFIIVLIIGIALALRPKNPDTRPFEPDDIVTVVSSTNTHNNKTQVGYSGEIIGTTERNKPVAATQDGGLESGYPVYGRTLNLTAAQKSAIISENNKLNSSKTANGAGPYDWMDENGYLYSGTRANPTRVKDANGKDRRLYKHSGSVGLYGGNVADDEPAVIKRLTFRPRSYTSYYDVTGLYAPAGELIKIQLTEADMNATGGIIIHIGQALYNGQANNIWSARNFNRMPVILNTMWVNKDTAVFEDGMWTAYVGSYLGGPIYVRDERVTFSVTVSGGVNYAHFILGVTTEEEYAEYCKSSAPYFDLEVWDRGVLHSGPVSYVRNFSYEDLYKAAVLWEKVSLVTTYNSNQGIVFLYDPFVAAGAAVAFPGRRSVNCPASWLTSSLNYKAIVTSGSWGNFHEYHHNFQNYGVGDTGEVTNNGLTLVSYSLFTKISAARQLSSYGGAGLSGWNQYTSATWALQRVNTGAIRSTNGLAVYSTLLHNLGQDAFIKSRGATGAAYFNKFAANTHQDFSYYASQITGYTGNLVTPAATDYPTFVPVSSVYQTGRSYMYDGEKRYIQTMQPYVIPHGQSFTVDLRPYTVNAGGQYEYGSIVTGNGFTYNLKSINANGVNGTFVPTNEEGVYTFTPNKEMLSGKIYVTLELEQTEECIANYGKLTTDDVELVIEFQQSYETKKAVLERTTYSFSPENMYTDAEEAYNNSFKGYDDVKSYDHSNPTQNANTDIWYWPADYKDNPQYATLYETHPEYFMDDNKIEVIDGKLYFPEEGKYRIFLRGRLNCALYYSLDGGKTYTLGATIKDKEVPKNSAEFRPKDEKTYFDVELEAESWLYIREVLIEQSTPARSFIGVGYAQWTVPMYTTRTETDENGNEIVHFYNSNGQEVTPEEASNTDPVPPTSANYATAYRCEYEFQKEFESDYFYTRNYNYNYVGEPVVVTDSLTQTYVAESSNYVPWSNTDEFAITNLFDGNPETYIHSGNGNANKVSASNPAIFTVDLGEEVKVNTLRLYPSNFNGNHRLAFPQNFSIQGSVNGTDFFEMGTWSGCSAPESYSDFELTDTYTVRYYRLTVTATRSGTQRLALADISLLYTFRLNGNGQNHYSPDNEIFKYSGNWQIAQTNASFGHVYLGNEGAEMKFEYEGSHFAVLSSKNFGKNYEVYIDGKLTQSIDVKSSDSDFAICYISPELSKGKHSVTIKCKGEANIDSIAFY